MKLTNVNKATIFPAIIRLRVLTLLGLFIVLRSIVYSQAPNNTNLHFHNFVLRQDTVLIESRTILDESVIINNTSGLPLKFDINNNRLIIRSNSVPDSVQLSYRTMNFNLGTTHTLLDSMRVAEDDVVIVTKLPTDRHNVMERNIFDNQKLEYRGSFSRGLSFGNTQDVVLNSNFNLQMQGDLGNGLLVRAAISDENLPIQPEGNTQVLQEFDKIFIEVKKDRTSIVAGDYELARPDSYFINYYKKLKGFSVHNLSGREDSWQLENRGSFAVSRGKFRRIMLETREGNQGPYRLTGENGELFLQVLSGTEKVYADGRLLKRGENFDYVIDYNRAELRFTTNIVITANIRIIVEYEYAVQSYLRSLLASESRFSKGRWSFKLNFYQEQDSKNLGANLELDSTDINILRETGDSPAFRSSIYIPEDPTVSSVIRYQLENGILRYAGGDTTNIVSASFTNVGSEKGSYVIDNEVAANGRVYKFVGEGMGEYLPVEQLIPPESRRMLSVGSRFEISDSSSAYIETAFSHFDQNRFSDIDNEDNPGYSIYGYVKDMRKLGTEKKWTLDSYVDIERKEKNFRSLNPYRPVEFSRDWNLENIDLFADQLLLNSLFTLRNSYNNFSYGLSRFKNEGSYEGNRHQWELRHTRNSWQVHLHGNYLNAQSHTTDYSFFRPRFELRKNLSKNLTTGFYFEKERNLRSDIVSDSLTGLSFDYELLRFYNEFRLSDKLSLKAAVSQRTDEELVSGSDELMRSTQSRNLELGGHWTEENYSRLRWQLVLRDFQVEEEFLNEEIPTRSFLGTIDHGLSLLNDGLKVKNYFESNSGQEPRFEFQYVEVQKGQGSYIWNDYNQDSIQQVNEFVIAPFSDQANFHKITVFNNEYISTNSIVLNHSMSIDPSRFLKNEKSILNKFYFTNNFRVNQKTLSTESGDLLRFVNFNFDDSTIVSNAVGLDQTLYFNRGKSAYDMQLSFRGLDNKIVQITGYERRKLRELFYRVRVNIIRSTDVTLESKIGEKVYDSEFFDTQDFSIDFYSLNPMVNYRPTAYLRAILKYKFEYSKNKLLAEEQSTINDIGIEFNFRQAGNSNLQLNFNFVFISYEGQNNTPVEFEMLQGLKNGKNALWNLSYTRRISGSVDLILNYNGRKSEENRVINTLGVQMRAVF